MTPPFLAGGGEMGARIRAFDWSATPLGPPDIWPPGLRTAVRLLLNTGHPMFIWWGPKLIQFYNDAYRETMGPERHPSALGQRGRECWQEIWDIIGPQIEQVMAGRGPTWHVDQLVPVTRFGRREEVYWTYSYGPIHDEQTPNGVGGVLVVCTETTQAVLATRQRTLEVQRWQRIFEQVPSFICILRGPEHVCDFVNAAHRRLFNSGSWLGKPVREAFPDLADQGFYEILDRVYATGERFVAKTTLVRYRHNPGGPMKDHFLDFVYEPVRDETGRITGIFCEGLDDTERRRTETALRESEAQLRFLDNLGEATRAATEASATMQLTARMLGEYLRVDRCAYADVEGDGDAFSIRHDWTNGVPSSTGVYRLHLFGPRAVEDLRAGRPLIVHDVDRELAPHEGADMFNSIGIKAIICYPHVRAGRLLAMMAVHQSVPRQWSEREITLVGAVVERSWAHIERIRTQEKLIEADRRKDEFLATLAHELRNPLAPIRQAARIAKSGNATDAQLQWSHDVIERQAAHMALLLDDLLDVSRITRGQLSLRRESVELAAIIDTAVETARPLIDARRHRLQIDLPDTPVRLEADALRLAQVVSNLLTNAAKYTDPAGQITLSARVLPDRVIISVRDSGIGIDAQTLPRVFEMFSQATSALDRAEGGLGIGLALVKGLVELHGGTVEARSAGLLKGSEFVISLPHAAVVSRQADVEGLLNSRGGLIPRRIVVADDNYDAAETLKMLLELDGHEVQAVQDGEQAVQAAAARPDLMFIDIGMPKLNGYEAASQIRAQPAGRAIKLVAITGWGQSEDRERAARAGFDRHLTKPVDLDALKTLMQQLCGP